MSAALAGPYVASAALLGLAGVAKLNRPTDTAGAMRAAGMLRSLSIRSQERLVRAGAVGEVFVAIAALAAPGPVPCALVATSYAAFTVFVVLALRKGWPLASCGCFGRRDTPPALSHALLDGAAAAVAIAWALTGPGSVPAAFAHQPAGGAPLALASAVTCLLAYLVFTYPIASRRSAR